MAGGRGRAVLARQPGEDRQAADHAAGRSLPSGGRDRVLPLVPLKNIFIITTSSRRRRSAATAQTPKQNIVGERWDADRALRVTLGALSSARAPTTAVMAVLPADHVIRPKKKNFQQVLNDCFDLAGPRPGDLLTIGISRPNRRRLWLHPRRRAAAAPAWREALQDHLFTARNALSKSRTRTRPSKTSNSGLYRWNAGIVRLGIVTVTRECRKTPTGNVRSLPALV